jgi:hypothetical protein
MAKARTEFLHVRLRPDERKRLQRAAELDYLDESTWARRAILLALDDWDDRRQRRSVAEPPPPPDDDVEPPRGGRSGRRRE